MLARWKRSELTNGGIAMKRTFFYDQNMKLVGRKNFKGEKKQIDFFIVTAGNQMFYAFSHRYTASAYDMCKSGIRVNELAAKRSRDTGIMRLVNYYNLMAPYLAEEYELKLA